MESAEAPVRHRIVVFSKVRNLEEAFERRWDGGTGPNAIFRNHSLGWYLYLEGSYEAIYVGDTKPPFNVGDKIKISFEKVS